MLDVGCRHGRAVLSVVDLWLQIAQDSVLCTALFVSVHLLAAPSMLRDPLNIALRMEAAVDALLRVVKRGRATDSSAQRMEVEGVVQQYKGARRVL